MPQWKVCPLRHAPFKVCPLRHAHFKVCPLRHAPSKVCPLRHAPFKVCPLRHAAFKVCPLKCVTFSVQFMFMHHVLVIIHTRTHTYTNTHTQHSCNLVQLYATIFGFITSATTPSLTTPTCWLHSPVRSPSPRCTWCSSVLDYIWKNNNINHHTTDYEFCCIVQGHVLWLNHQGN